MDYFIFKHIYGANTIGTYIYIKCIVFISLYTRCVCRCYSSCHPLRLWCPGRDAGGVGPGANRGCLAPPYWRQYHLHFYIHLFFVFWLHTYMYIYIYIYRVCIDATLPVIHSDWCYHREGYRGCGPVAARRCLSPLAWRQDRLRIYIPL